MIDIFRNNFICIWCLDGKNAYSSKRRLRTDMISSPQGDLKHTGHVGLDGAYFGDVSFLGDKVNEIYCTNFEALHGNRLIVFLIAWNSRLPKIKSLR